MGEPLVKIVPGNETFSNDRLQHLIDALLKEPFSVEEHFATKTLVQIGQLLETNRDQFEKDIWENQPPEALASNENFLRCKEAYCSILLEIEACGIEDANQKTLAEINHSKNIAFASAIKPKVEPTSAETGENLLEPSFDIIEEPNFTKENGEGDGDSDLMECAKLDSTSTKKLNLPPIEEGEESLLNPEGNPAGRVSPASGDAQAVAQDDIVPEANSAVENPVNIDLAPEFSQFTEALEKTNVIVGNETKPQSAAAIEYREFVNFLDKQLDSDSFLFSPNLIERMKGQSLCLGLEAETLHKIENRLEKFWKTRKHTIGAVLNSDPNNLSFHMELVRFFGQAFEKSSGLAEQKNFFNDSLSELREILTTNDVKDYRPNLLATGILLFLFGQDRDWTNVNIRNYLGVKGVTSEQLLELYFRLYNAHTTRKEINSIHFRFRENQFQGFQENFDRILEILSNLRFTEGS